MASSGVAIERAGDVAIIRLNAPETLNAMTPPMFEALAAAFQQCAETSRAIVLAAAGRAFSSGINLASLEQAGPGTDPPDAGLLLETHVNPLIAVLKGLAVPWIAAVRGPVVGVASPIVLCADMVLASDTSYFLPAFSRLGLIPDGGATWLLMRTLGRLRAMEVMLLGDRLPAQTALQWGLLNRIVPDAQLDEAVLDLAQRLAAGPTRAFALIRALSWIAADEDLPTVLAAERAAQREAGLTGDAIEGRNAFARKRTPDFTGS